MSERDATKNERRYVVVHGRYLNPKAVGAPKLSESKTNFAKNSGSSILGLAWLGLSDIDVLSRPLTSPPDPQGTLWCQAETHTGFNVPVSSSCPYQSQTTWTAVVAQHTFQRESAKRGSRTAMSWGPHATFTHKTGVCVPFESIATHFLNLTK